jgi:hypothetical protein
MSSVDQDSRVAFDRILGAGERRSSDMFWMVWNCVSKTSFNNH